MAKVRLELGAELDMLTSGELDARLREHGQREREAAFGWRHIGLPVLRGNIAAAAIALGADQPDGQYCGPPSGFCWRVDRVSVAGLAANDAVQLLKGAGFVCWIAYQPGFYHPGGVSLLLKPGEFLRISGTGLNATGQVTVTGEATSVPGPLAWKLQ